MWRKLRGENCVHYIKMGFKTLLPMQNSRHIEFCMGK